MTRNHSLVARFSTQRIKKGNNERFILMNEFVYAIVSLHWLTSRPKKSLTNSRGSKSWVVSVGVGTIRVGNC